MASFPRLSRQTRAVLAALLERPADWRHGYAIMQRTGLKSGTLYPVLMRLADHGLVEAEWRTASPPAGAPRHVYRLTAPGRTWARAVVAPAETDWDAAHGFPA